MLKWRPSAILNSLQARLGPPTKSTFVVFTVGQNLVGIDSAVLKISELQHYASLAWKYTYFNFGGAFAVKCVTETFCSFIPLEIWKKLNLHESKSVKSGFLVCSREVSEIGVTNLKRKKIHGRVIFHLFAFTGRAIALNFGAPDGWHRSLLTLTNLPFFVGITGRPTL